MTKEDFQIGQSVWVLEDDVGKQIYYNQGRPIIHPGKVVDIDTEFICVNGVCQWKFEWRNGFKCTTTNPDGYMYYLFRHQDILSEIRGDMDLICLEELESLTYFHKKYTLKQLAKSKCSDLDDFLVYARVFTLDHAKDFWGSTKAF